MDRQQLHGGDAQALQVADRRGVRQAGIGAAQFLGDLRVPLGEALDVRLVDHHLVCRMAWQPIVGPVEIRVGHHAAGHEGGAVGRLRAAVGVVEGVGEDGLVPAQVALDGLGIGIEQQLGGVAALSLLGRPRAVHAVAVALAGRRAGDVAVPHEAGRLRQVEA